MAIIVVQMIMRIDNTIFDKADIRRSVFTEEEWLTLEDIASEIIKNGHLERKDWEHYEFYKAKVNRRLMSTEAYVETMRCVVYMLGL